MKFEIKSLLSVLPLFFLLNPGNSWSQNTAKEFKKELNITFDASEEKKLDRAAKLLDEADNLLQDANQQFSNLTGLEKKERTSSAYDAALKKLFTSSETYREAYGLAYSVFRDKGEIFWKKMSRVSHRASGMEKAKYYEGSGIKNLNRSLIRRQQVLESDRFEYSLGIMKDAVDLEKLAVRDQSRAVQICSDYPVEYNYGWDDDKTIQEIVALMRDPNVHEPPNDIFATVDKSTKVDSAIYKEVIFKVQIAAHTLPLTEEYLNAVYQGTIKIDMIYEEDWYKYSIGIYKSFDEADATLREINIKKAFVVAYQEGKKISTQEAIQLTADRP
jgi:hypothetical protein